MNERNLERYSAYHGGTWKRRAKSHAEECAEGRGWRTSRATSEFSGLESVLLYRPPSTPPRIDDPERVQHLARLDWKKLLHEQRALARAYESQGARIEWLDADAFPGSPPNLMFLRDLFFSTPWGAVLARMASPVRAGEEKWAQAALAALGIPILCLIRGKGTFEGADALWLSPRHLLVGVGNRTNAEGFRQLKALLSEFGVSCTAIRLPRKVQHLLGLLQPVDRGRALLRASIAPPSLKRALRKSGYEIIPIEETPEVTHRQGLNVVAVAPGRILMPADCPSLKRRYSEAGLTVVAEVRISQLINAAGGIACASGILRRSILSP